jgi:F-type H+-transporting ATPase subunit b
MKTSHLFVIVLSCVLAFASASYLAGQAKPTQQAPSAQSAQSSVPPGSSDAGRPGGLAQEQAGRKEAEAANTETEEDKTAQFKRSPSVQWLARHTGLSLDGAYWLSFGINFLIVVVLIGLGLKSSLPAMFRNRTHDVQRAIEEARRASDDAGRRLSVVEDRLSKLNVSISELETHAESESRAEEERLWAAAEEEKRKIVQSAEQEIAAAANAARRELKLLAVELAMANAEKQVRVDATQDKQLVRDFVEQLGEQTRNGSKG